MSIVSKPADPALSQSLFLAVILPVLVVVAYILMISLAPRDQIQWLHGETGPVEIATALAFLAATILSVAMAMRIKRADPHRPGYVTALYILIALVSLFMMLEEISYGQHFFGFESPEVFQEQNKQHETNLHNLWNDAPSSALRTVANVGLPVFGILIPVIVSLQPWGYKRGNWSWYLLPRAELVTWIVLSMLISPFRKIGGFSEGYDHIWRGTFSEFKELLWALTGLVLLIVLYRRIFKLAPKNVGS